LSAAYGGEVDATRFNVTVSRFDTRGFSAIDTRLAPLANPDPDGYRNESDSGNLIQRISAQHEVGVLLYHSRGRLDYDNAFGAPTDTHQSAQDLRMSQAYWEAHPVEPWTSRLTLGEGTDYRTDLLNGAFDSSSNTRSRQLIWDNRLQAAPAHEFAVGLEALRQELQNSDLLPQRRDRNADVARLGYLGRLGAHSLQVNLRTEDYSDFGRANTHFLGYGYDVTQTWRLTASTSTAFRAPTFIDLFGFRGVGGNAALRPERARTRELGVQWADGPHLVRVVAFDTRYQDAITFDVTARNVRKASVDGVESSYSGRLAGFDLRAALTVQDATEQEPGGEELPAIRRAKRYGSLAAYRSLDRLRLGGELIASGARPDIDIVSFARISQAGYSVINLTARYDIDKRLFVGARLSNALDQKYQLVNGFNTPRRGVFLTAGWQP